MSNILWRLFSDVRAEERERFLFFLVLGALLSGAQTIGLVGAESILLSRRGPEALPRLFVLASAVTVVGTLLYAAAVGRARNDRLFVVLLGIGAASAAAGFAALSGSWPGVPTALLCGWFVAQAILLNHFLTFAGDYFDTLASKRLLPRLTLGGSAGGAVGGAAAAGLAGLSPEGVVAAWAVALAGASAWVAVFGARLQRWRALGFEEADETSVQGIVASIRYARRSSLSRRLVLSVVAMVVALLVSQYLYSAIFAESFARTEELAAFFGVFLAASNVLEIAVALAVTPLAIRRFGIASANLIHAGTSVLSFLVLAIDARLAAAIVARLNREMLDAALAQPVRNLVYNALPMRLRGRMRAFLEGILHYAAMSLAGGALLAAGRPEPIWLCALGALAALLYLAANLRVRGAYLDELMQQLLEGRLDLSSVGAALGMSAPDRLARLWEEVLRQRPVPTAVAAELAPLLAEQELWTPLLQAVRHPEARVRRACVESLGSTELPAARPALRAALEDPDAGVRLAAVRSGGTKVGRDCLEGRLDDPDPQVRAAAAARLGSRGAEVLGGMVRSETPGEALAALSRLPLALRADAAQRLADPEPRVRAAALACFTRWGRTGNLPRVRLERGLEDPLAEVRVAAVRAADVSLGDDACAVIARALDDPAREVRMNAAQALGRRGDPGVEAAEPYLRRGPWTADAALGVLGRADTPWARSALRRELRTRVVSAWENLLALHALVGETDTKARFLRCAHGDALALNVRLAFRVLRHLEGADLVAGVDRALRLGGSRARSDALELLSNLGERTSSTLLALLLEHGPLEERLQHAGQLPWVPTNPAAVLQRAPHSTDRWVRMAGSDPRGSEGAEETMERLLALKRVPLFAHLSLDQLESIHRAMKEEHFARGEAVVREGERGNRLYVLLEGELEITSGQGTPSPLLLNRMRPVSALGEMAVLNEHTRTATAIASEDSLLASLDGDRLRELILHMPEIAFVIFGQLTERCRRAEDRLRELHARTLHAEESARAPAPA